MSYNPYARTGGFGLPATTRAFAPLSLPSPTRGGGAAAQLNLGDIGTQLGGELVGIGLDWLRQRIIPGGGGAQPGTTLAADIPAAGCPQGQFGIPPFCLDLQPGGATQGGGMVVTTGEAVMGRYGAALQPAVRTKQIKRCLRGMVLGNDGLCYNRRDLNKRDRMWIPGRKPLLTGGDLNAIARAARAAGKMKTQSKRLQKLGLLPKPNRGRGGKSQHLNGVTTRFLPGTSVVNVD